MLLPLLALGFSIAFVVSLEAEAKKSSESVRRFSFGAIGASSMCLGCMVFVAMLAAPGAAGLAGADEIIESISIEDIAEPAIVDAAKESTTETPASITATTSSDVGPDEDASDAKAKVASEDAAEQNAELTDDNASELIGVLATEDAPTEIKTSLPSTEEAKEELDAALMKSQVVIPPGRPDWIESPSQHNGREDDFTYVCSAPHTTKFDADQYLDDELVQAMHTYIDKLLGNNTAASRMADKYDIDFIRSHSMIRETYNETIQASVGPMEMSHAMLVFDDDFRAELADDWHEVKATTRLAGTGLASGAVFSLLLVLFGYLRVDRRTKGYYSGRLQMLAAVAILSLVAAGAYVVNWIPWV